MYDDTNEITIDESNKTLNPHIVKTKGRPRNGRYKSFTEVYKDSSSKGGGINAFIQDNNEQGTSQGNKCSNYYATNHNIRRCIAPCKLCKKECHTYVKCKGKNVENDG